MLVTDVLGRVHQFDAPPRRVVSLVPSLTETLFAFGAGTEVVGITDYCIFPPHLDRRRIGGTKNPRVDDIREIEPDLVYANLEENLPRHADAIARFAPVFATEPRTLDNVHVLFETLGAIHGVTEKSRIASDDLRRERDAARRPPFLFACAIWKAPWMWCGGDTYVSALVEAAGGFNVLGSLSRYPTLEPAAVLASRPDVIFLPDEPYPFTPLDAAALDGTRVIGPFPGHLFTWHGTRTILGLRFLQSVL